MCCILATFLIVGARGVLFLIWLFQPVRFELAFAGTSFIVPLLGFLFLPWTTLMFVLVAPGGLDTIDWFGIILALVIDIGSYASGGVSGRNRYAAQRTY